MKHENSYDTIWRSKFAPQLINIPKELYQEYLPLVDVIPYAILDKNVIENDVKFQEVISQSYNRICEISTQIHPYGLTPSMRQLIEQLGLILSGKQNEIFVFHYSRLVKKIQVNQIIREECRKIQWAILERLLLFEDLRSIIPEDDVDFLEISTIQLVKPTIHKFNLGRKADLLNSLVTTLKNENKQIVIFVRNILVGTELAQILKNNELNAECIHGGVEESIRNSVITNFKNKSLNILLVTRQLYGRGFDLPEADVAIFYSPKENEKTMWQEMLRIRSTVGSPKLIYIFFYCWTAETEKLYRLISKMEEVNANWEKDRYKWSYSEMTIPHDRNSRARSKSSNQNHHLRIYQFFMEITNHLDYFQTSSYLEIYKSINAFADQNNLVEYFPQAFIRVTTAELTEMIYVHNKAQNGDRKDLLRELSTFIPVYLNSNQNKVGKIFWQDICDSANIQLNKYSSKLGLK